MINRLYDPAFMSTKHNRNAILILSEIDSIDTESIMQSHLNLVPQNHTVIRLPLPYFYQKESNSLKSKVEVLEKIDKLKDQISAIVLKSQSILSGSVVSQLKEFCIAHNIIFTIEI